MCVVHLEPEEFVNILFRKGVRIEARVYPIHKAGAVVVHLCHVDETLYYMDRVETSPLKEEAVHKMSFYDLHAELYQKICLDERLRMGQ